MVRVKFADLLEIYLHTEFESPNSGTLMIASPEILGTLKTIEEDNDAAADANITHEAVVDGLAVGQQLAITIQPPRLGLGIYSANFASFLDAPDARRKEPRAYFIVEGAVYKEVDPQPPILDRYRRTLKVIEVLIESATYFDETRRSLSFVKDGKFEIPLAYSIVDLQAVNLDDAASFVDSFKDQLHRDQKLEILAESVINLALAQPSAGRLAFILTNLRELERAVRDGYKLFASNFSYGKIRSEVEAARLEYIAKIQKTFTDIQGQLLGIPVATVIVASQLKPTQRCGAELWTDVAVLTGAWLFLALLLIAIFNQWSTLNVIRAEGARQRTKLARDFAELSGQFAEVFNDLAHRIRLHKLIAVAIATAAIAGAIFASHAFTTMVRTDVSDCLFGTTAFVIPMGNGQ